MTASSYPVSRRTDEPSWSPIAPTLAAHEAAVRRDLDALNIPAREWTAPVVAPDGSRALDVAIIGAGMCGLAAAIALIFKGVRNIRVFDRSPRGREGPWTTFARMDQLRSPKTLPGPALGVPSLTFRAWYEASLGSSAWDALYKIPNGVWQDYLNWLRSILDLPVENDIAAARITPDGGLIRIEFANNHPRRFVWARKAVIATGRGGAGGDHIPGFVDSTLFPDLAAHTNDEIDFSRLAGKRVAVIGAGPSAWDNAATALEKGAARIDMYVRRPILPQHNKGRGSAFPAFFLGWPALDDAARWETLAYLDDVQAPPPHETVLRAIRLPGFNIHLGSPVERAARKRDSVEIVTEKDGASHSHDFLIVGSGFHIDMARNAELSDIARHIATWGDRYQPPANLRRPALARFPYLGPGFELLEKSPGACPGLDRIHLFNHGAFASHGAVASDIPGVNVGAETLARSIVQSLFRADFDVVRSALEAFAEPELEKTPFFVP